MAGEHEALKAYEAAVGGGGEQACRKLAPHLADDVVVAGIIAGGAGKEAVLAALAALPAPALLAPAEWSEPVREDGALAVRAMLPGGRPFGGIAFWVTLDATGKIKRVDQELVAAPAPPPSPVALGDDVREAFAAALANGTPVVVAYVDAHGLPHVSLRGTAQVLSADQVAVWARNPEGGLVKAIPANPHMTLFYRDPKTRTSYQVSGRAHITQDAGVREAVFSNSPELERNLDPRRRGVAVVIDVDFAEGAGPTGRFHMERHR